MHIGPSFSHIQNPDVCLRKNASFRTGCGLPHAIRATHTTVVRSRSRVRDSTTAPHLSPLPFLIECYGFSHPNPPSPAA
ncbi:MAG: hypothetical protein AAGE59_23875 [Cyanobacteria bacterium P01_F01_bin.86]